MNLLTVTILVPLAGALLVALLPRTRPALLKGVTVGIGLLTLVLAGVVWAGFDPAEPGFQFVERVLWIPSLGAWWHVGVDGMSLILFALTTLLTPLALLGTWDAVTEKVKGFTVSLLLLEAGMLGVFVARDLFLFYVFWEAMLIPMYLLIGIWGGPRRIHAAVKFILYTLVGSLLMLVALLILYFLHGRATGLYTFDLNALEQFTVPVSSQLGLFLAFTLAFAIKVPLWPFHTWLPDAHVEAPTAGSVLLAGVLLKMGTYGLLRFSIPLFPVAASLALPWIGTLAVIGILYGGLVAWVQKDIKSLVAYSSVAHLGFVVLGSFSFRTEGIAGAILQMVNHGLSTGALFLLVGYIYVRRHTRDIDEFGGLAKVMPRYAAILLVVAFSSAGLPGLNGFVGEFLILLGAFRTVPVLAVLAVPGVIIAALYLLRLLRGVLWGPLTREANRGLHDLDLRETLVMVPLLVLIVWIGVYPRPFLRLVEPTAQRIAVRMAVVRDEPLPPPPPSEHEMTAASDLAGTGRAAR
jgi:NADH-quinone oxidoreductase subunit M